MVKISVLAFTILLLFACNSSDQEVKYSLEASKMKFTLVSENDMIKVTLLGMEKAIVTQNAKPNFRPYIHPILAPNSNAELTQYSPDHHKHQTGLYWGFTRVNGTGADKETLKKWFYNPDKPDQVKKQIGRDYFHNPGEGYWEKVSSNVLIPEGEEVKWQTVYKMLDENGEAILEETQTWTFKEKDGKYLLSQEWQGKAIKDITVNEFDYGGMFLRMPWHEGIKGEVVNAARQKNEKAEGQRAMWVDAGMEIEGLDQIGHIAILDHPENDGFPQTWRVDGQLGIGPARSITGDWGIKAGEVVTFLHQIVAYSGPLNDIEMKDTWADYVGDDGMYNAASLWSIAQQEGRDAKFLSPEEAVASMTIKNGYQVNAYAAEPMITQPMAFCWDDKGRMWIAENRDYESRGHGFSNSGDSRILILEDEDGDGIADSKKVFLEGIPFPSAIAVGHDGLYLGAPPNFLYVPDADQDDKADEEDIKVLLTGWGIRDRHETINSLHWGPDGWLYGLEGFATPSKIRKPKGEGKIYKHRESFPDDLLDADGVDINGGVWRYHPLKDRFEAVAHGFSNPWGIDYDAKGQLLISACVIPHLFHIIPGGIYHRQGGQHFNPYVYDDIQTIVDHRHRSAHGGARIYQSDAFPEDQRGKIFMANIHEHAVLSDNLLPNGSGFTATHGEDFMLANNAQWIGFSMEIGPEGGLYVLDWHDADICGNEVVNKETGRVFRIMPEKSEAEQWDGRYEDLSTLNDLQLADLQLSKSNWHAQRSRVILQYRASKNPISPDAITKLEQILSTNPKEDLRLRALWTLHVSKAITNSKLSDLLQDKDQYVRAWAIQLLTEDQNASKETLKAFEEMAKKEKSPVVRLYLAAALQRMEAEERWSLLEGLVTFSEDITDPNIPYMLWFGLEPNVVLDPERALALASICKIPIITQKIARRLLDGGKLETLVDGISKHRSAQKELLEGMLAGLESGSDINAPENWDALYKSIKSKSNLSEVAKHIAEQFGNIEIVLKQMETVNNSSAKANDRQQALKILATNQREELLDLLPALLDDDVTRKEAIRAIAAFDKKELGEILMDKYESFNQEEKQATIQTMASRSSYGWQLASMLKENKIPKKDIPVYVAVQLKRVVGNGFVEIWGPIDEITGDKQTQLRKYLRILNESDLAAADPHNGRLIYQRTCITCHKMHGEGGIVGPDLTGSNRTNIPYLLSNILDPSGDIQDDYKMVVITTQDGRTHTGNIIAQNDRTLTIRTVSHPALAISKSEIQSQEQTPNSIMPEGLLNMLTETEILNLMAYLSHLEPISDKDL
jgi:putative membrane-bound dehydrogenase-like protein